MFELELTMDYKQQNEVKYAKLKIICYPIAQGEYYFKYLPSDKYITQTANISTKYRQSLIC